MSQNDRGKQPNFSFKIRCRKLKVSRVRCIISQLIHHIINTSCPLQISVQKINVQKIYVNVPLNHNLKSPFPVNPVLSSLTFLLSTNDTKGPLLGILGFRAIATWPCLASRWGWSVKLWTIISTILPDDRETYLGIEYRSHEFIAYTIFGTECMQIVFWVLEGWFWIHWGH